MKLWQQVRADLAGWRFRAALLGYNIFLDAREVIEAWGTGRSK